jgi:hypothetical protein
MLPSKLLDIISTYEEVPIDDKLRKYMINHRPFKNVAEQVEHQPMQSALLGKALLDGCRKRSKNKNIPRRNY